MATQSRANGSHILPARQLCKRSWTHCCVALLWLCSSALAAEGSSVSPSQLIRSYGDELGLQYLRLYAQIPIDDTGNKTAVLIRIWLRRLSPLEPGPFALAHQRNADVLYGFIYFEDPGHTYEQRKWVHFLTHRVDYSTWLPTLKVELSAARPAEGPSPPRPAGLPLEVDMVPLDTSDPHFISPLFVAATLPPGVGDCFRVYDTSTPTYKASVCLPARPHSQLCASLRPASSPVPVPTSPAAPALWSVVPVQRNQGMRPSEWAATFEAFAVQLHHHVTYHAALGVAGTLVYADAWARRYYEAAPLLQPLLRAGALRLVAWEEMPERRALVSGPAAVMGQGQQGASPEQPGAAGALHSMRTAARAQLDSTLAGADYDKALVYSHAAAGLAACGADVMLMMMDLSEFLHSPQGQAWPQMAACLRAGRAPREEGGAEGAGDASGLPSWQGRDVVDPVAGYNVLRYDVLASGVPAAEEASLWAAAADSLAGHPLQRYDLVRDRASNRFLGKTIISTAQRLAFQGIHTVYMQHGAVAKAPTTCAVLLHVPGMSAARRSLAVSRAPSLLGPGEAREVPGYRRLRQPLFEAAAPA